VDDSEAPEISLTVMLPVDMADATSEPPEFSVTENGRKARIVEARALGGARDPLDVVLVVDTSGSMRGQPLADAKEAAKGFVNVLAESDSVALIAFDSEPRLAAGFTEGRSTLLSALSGLQAQRETAVYDALLMASEIISSRATPNRSIVLLSDGGDTVSTRSLDDAAKAVGASGAPVYVVALESPEFDPRTLEAIATASGGRTVGVSESAQLKEEFTTIAQEIQNLWQITYESDEPSTKDLEIDVTARSDTGEATLETAIENPLFGATPGRVDLETTRIIVRSDPVLLVAALGVAFLAAALLVTGLMLLFVRRRTGLEHLEYYDQLQAGGEGEAGRDAQGRDTFRSRIIEVIDYVAGRRGITEVLREKLERAGLPLRPLEYMYVHILSVVAAGFITQLLTGSLFAGILMVFAAAILPLLALEIAIDRRRRAFEDQLPDILALLAGSLRTGWGLLQSLELVVNEVGEPAAGEFRRVLAEGRLGFPLDLALEKAAGRVDSEDFRWTVVAINIQRDVGGNLAEVLDILSQTMRDRAALRRHIRALTAEGRLSAIILYGLPFLALLFLSVIRPEYLGVMFSHPLGLILVGLGVLLLVVGGFWLNRAVKVEV
jgi:tight adherence protein B